jgi:predicted  nucleic acid-binding Zn-ribbon protein
LAHLRERLPELAELDELAQARSDLDRERIRLETAVSDLSADQRKADADVEQVRSRRTRNQQRLDSGQVGSARDLENLQHEVVSLDRRIATLEDEELEVMEALEAAETELAATRRQLAGLDDGWQPPSRDATARTQRWTASGPRSPPSATDWQPT